MDLSLSETNGIWVIVAATLVGVIARPRGLPEWVAATVGACALVLFGLLSPASTVAAIARGDDVYLFLIGMMLLAEVARRGGLFDWIAAHAVRLAAGSRMRLFGLVYLACVVVTVILSNDATAVVLTPAVAAAVRRARVPALPYVYTCAFVANAASFVLPISNPANLVVFGRDLPSLGPWLGIFALPAGIAIVATYVALRACVRGDLRGPIAEAIVAPRLGRAGTIALVGVSASALALAIASGLGARLGLVTLVAALIVFACAASEDRAAIGPIVRGISWSVVPLVAGLFVLVAAVDRTGLAGALHHAIAQLARGPAWRGVFAAGIATSIVTNVTNNLPAGLLAGLALASAPHASAIASATAIGIDVGPNLSVTGSLATVLWLVALRREGIAVGTLAFLRVGALVMPPALLLALAALALVAR